jgi:hypothetical protein
MYFEALFLVRAIKSADTAQAYQLILGSNIFQRWATPLLRQMYEESEPQSKERLHASLALLPVDPGQVDYLYKRLLNAGPTELLVIREALSGYRSDLVERLWKVLGSAQEDGDRRFRAACVLASYDPSGQAKAEGWQDASQFITDHLLAAVQMNPSHYAPLLEMLRPVRQRLLGPLSEVYRNRQRPESERSFATTILAAYASDKPSILADLLVDADEKQFAVIYPKFKEQSERRLPFLIAEMDRSFPDEVPLSDERREMLAKRQANAAVALFKLNQPTKVWPLLKHRPDPRARSYLIHRLAPLGADARAIIQRLDEEPDITIRRALLLSLGEFDEKSLPPDARQAPASALAEGAGRVSHRLRSGAARRGGMAAPDLATGRVAETND